MVLPAGAVPVARPPTLPPVSPANGPAVFETLVADVLAFFAMAAGSLALAGRLRTVPPC